MGEEWRDGVYRQVEALGRWFGGRFVPEPGPSDELTPASAFLDVGTLRAAIDRSAVTKLHGGPDRSGPEADPRVVVSRFTRHYMNSMTVVALIGLGHGIGLDVSAGRCSIVTRHGLPWSLVLDLSAAEVLQCAERPASWPVGGRTVETLAELREYVWERLYAGHLWPLVELTTTLGLIPSGLAWTNAAEWPAMVCEAAVEYLDPPYAERLAEEATALIEAPRLPGLPAGTNPVRDRYELLPGDGNGFPETVQTRKLCCLTYLLPDRFGRLCQTCPYLPLPERIALVRERHGVPIGGAGGPAEQRSIELGLDRPSTRHMLAHRAAAGTEAAPARGTAAGPDSVRTVVEEG